MGLQRVDVTPLLRPLRSELLALLASLTGGDWTRATACPGWDVHAIGSHLLGVELGNVSIRRDHWGQAPGRGEDLAIWLNAFNQQWVDAMRRVSPRLLIEHLDGPPFRGTCLGAGPGRLRRASPMGDRRRPSAGMARSRPLVSFTVEGDGGGTWLVNRAGTGWELAPGPPPGPVACEARTTVPGAIKLYARDPGAPALRWRGDGEVADALSKVKAVLG